MKLRGNGSAFMQSVVGEQYYQDALIKIAGPYSKERKRIRCEATLFLEPDNPHDPYAVRVEIEGSKVGYIPRDEAPVLRRQLQQLGVTNGQRVTVDAVIGGGLIGERYGVYLDFDLPDDEQVVTPSMTYSTPASNAPGQASVSQRRPERKPRPWWKFW